jgi:hypothetical protein
MGELIQVATNTWLMRRTGMASITAIASVLPVIFRIVGLESDRLVEWILEQRLPFDSLYYYGGDRPIHISYGSQQRQSIWTFTDEGVPTRKGCVAKIVR